MSKLAKICAVSLLVSFAAFSSERTKDLELNQQNQDSFLIDTFTSAFSKIKNFVVGKVLGGCDDVKKAGITDESMIPSKDDCAGDSACLDNRKLMKSCF